jgi:HlyD family secretion protein
MANDITVPGRRLKKTTSDEDMPRALLEFYSPSAGMIATPINRGARSVTFLVSGLVAGLIVIASVMPLDRVVTGDGTLSAMDSTIVVQPFDQSIVHSINVREGDVVKPGQVLARLDPTMSEADVVNLRQQVQSLSAEVARRTAEAKGVDYKPDLSNPASTGQEAAFLERQAEYRARMNSFDAQIQSARADLAGFQSSITAYAQRLKVASDVQSMRLELQAQALGSRLNSLAAMDSVAEMQRSEADAVSSANSARAKITSTQGERDAFAKNWSAQTYSDLTDAQRKLYQASDDLSRADLRHKLVIFKASKPAIVLNIAKVSVGSVLTPGADFITLIPADSPLEVDAQIPASQSGYVRLGDPVTLKFLTLPYLTYGGATGTVTNISADSFNPDEKGVNSSSGLSGGGGGKLYYKARIAIDKYDLRNTPRGFHLTPGMPMSADVKVGKRTIMQFMLSSVVPTFKNGMREP